MPIGKKEVPKMVDEPLIIHFKDEYGTREAKVKLREYAQDAFNINLDSRKSYDNMVKDLYKSLEAQQLSDRDEDNDHGDENGLTLNKLIVASDVVDGAVINYNEEPDENLVKEFETIKEKQKEEILLDSPSEVATEILEVLDIEDSSSDVDTISDRVILDNTPHKEDEPEDQEQHKIEEEKSNSSPATEQRPVKNYRNGFRPAFSLIGARPGYYTAPSWILDWIDDNADWKSKPEHFGSQWTKIIETYIYYTQINGSILLKDSVSGKFKLIR